MVLRQIIEICKKYIEGRQNKFLKNTKIVVISFIQESVMHWHLSYMKPAEAGPGFDWGRVGGHVQ